MAKRNKKTEVQDGGKRAHKESGLITKESLCATLGLFSVLIFLMLCTRSLVFGKMGVSVHVFLTGAFGYFAYPLLLLIVYFCVQSLFGIQFINNKKLVVLGVILLIIAFLLAHTAATYSWSRDGYLKRCYKAGENFPKATLMGWTGGLVVYALSALLSPLGTVCVFVGAGLFCLYLFVLAVRKQRKNPAEQEQPQAEQPLVEQSNQSQQYFGQPYNYAQNAAPQAPSMQSVAAEEAAQSFAMPTVEQRPGVSLQEAKQGGYSPFGVNGAQAGEIEPFYENPRDLLFSGSPQENYQKNLIFDPNANVNRRNAAQPLQPMVTEEYTPSYTKSYEEELNAQTPQITPSKVVTDVETPEERVQETAFGTSFTAPVEPEPFVAPAVEERQPVCDNYEHYEEDEDVDEPAPTPTAERDDYERHEYMGLFSADNPNVFGDRQEEPEILRGFGENVSADRYTRNVEPEEAVRGYERVEETPTRAHDGFSLLDDEDEPYVSRGREEVEPIVDEEKEIDTVEMPYTRGGRDDFDPTPIKIPEPTPPKPRIIRPYVAPRLDDMDCRDIEPTANQEEVEETKQNIISTLEDFKVTGASIASVTFGPTVTRYNVTIPRHISPKKVVALDQSIAISLHSNGVNVYPNYEDGVVSIEVPNKVRQFVQLGCMLSGDTFVNAKPGTLMFAMGKDVANRKIYGDISKMIHMLVAGASGMGKSVFLGSLIISLISKYSPEELRLILIDPKKTEFVLYNDLPHLMINEIITDVNKTVQSLNWAIGEMNRRYALFEQMSRTGTYVVNLDQYNQHLDKKDRLPKIVIIIDELADLMLYAKKEMEDRIQNLTQKARAAGIHLIVATQRPSTDVITGVIKSNLPTRIAFSVATDVDSRVILDQTGAQKLLGKGDFLYTMSGINEPVRVQSAFISPEDCQRVVNFIKQNNEAYYDDEATSYINNTGGRGGDDSSGSEMIDPIYIEALRCVVQTGSASISMIQRKLRAGYNRAGKIIEWLEEMGYISAFDGSKARKALITKEEFESKYGPLQ